MQTHFKAVYQKESFPSVPIGKSEWQVRKASRCSSKQQQRSCAAITLLLLVRATYTVYGCCSSHTSMGRRS